MGMMECPKHGPQFLSTGFILGIKKRAYCPECLSEEKYYAAKNAGRRLPFVGYEHTLDWRHLTEVERLEKALRSQYQFRRSEQPHGFRQGADALIVLPGCFTEPLIIIIYYVVLANEQDYLLTIIDRFFLGSAYPQRKIRFYEAERWHEEVRGNTHSYQSLEGELLREVIVA
jgi:hypothetical protein